MTIYPRGHVNCNLLIRSLLFCCAGLIATSVSAQTSTGVIRGTVKFEANNELAEGATVILAPTGRITQADENGAYEFTNVSAGHTLPRCNRACRLDRREGSYG